jgi:hypothetical protein
VSSRLFSISLLIITLSSAENCVFNITKLLHVGLEFSLVSVPSNVTDEQSSLVLLLSLRLSFLALMLLHPAISLSLRFFLSFSFVFELVNIFLSLRCGLLLLKFTSDDTLRIKVGVVYGVLDF